MRTSPVRRWTLPVQWRVGPAFRSSVMDQILKYGSCVTKGTAGGRTVCAIANAPKRVTTKMFADRKGWRIKSSYCESITSQRGRAVAAAQFTWFKPECTRLQCCEKSCQESLGKGIEASRLECNYGSTGSWDAKLQRSIRNDDRFGSGRLPQAFTRYSCAA